MADIEWFSVVTRRRSELINPYAVFSQGKLNLKRLPIAGARFNHDGTRVLSWGGDLVRVTDPVTGKVLVRIRHAERVLGAEFSPDEQQILSWDSGGGLRASNANSGAELRSANRGAILLGATYCCNGERIVAWGDDGLLLVADAQSFATLASHKLSDGSPIVAVDRGQSLVAFSGKEGFHLIDAKSGRRLWGRDLPEVKGATFFRHGRWIVIWGNDEICLRNPRDGRLVVRPFSVPRAEDAVVCDGERRLLSWAEMGKTQIVKVATGEILAQFASPGITWGAMEHPDGQRVYAWGSGLCCFDATTGKKTFESAAGAMECVWGAALSLDGRRVLCWTFDGVVRVLDARDGDPIGEFRHASPAWGAVFDRSGDRVLTWDRDGSLVMLQMPQDD